MIPYTLHVGLLLSVCLLFYKLLLQKETYYRLNRVVLLACLAMVFALPLIQVPQQWALRQGPAPVSEPVTLPKRQPTVQAQLTLPSQSIIQPIQIAHPVQQQAQPQESLMQRIFRWAVYLYWFGVVVFGANLLLQVTVLLWQVYRRPAIQDGQFRIIELDDDKAPCSFGNNIFINPAKYDYETYSQILLHEKAHITQGHSFDLLLAELVLAFQWFNPFAWLYRKEVESNLEYLADSAVLHNAAVEMSEYQMNLLKVSVPNLSLRITTNYNQSLLKKRIVMMNAKRSNIHTAWKYLFLLPLMVFMVCALNQPMMAISKPATGKTVMITTHAQTRDEGNWKATIKGTKMEMRLYDGDEDHNYMTNSDMLVSEFTALPIERDGEFKLVREAGTMVFTGKFSGNVGKGKYKYTEDKNFTEYLRSEGLNIMNDDDKRAFFFLNVKKSYIAMLKKNGYTNLSKDDVISATALKVDEPYIHYWKQSGFSSLGINDLVSGKALGITPEYVNDVKKAGYTNLTFDQLVSFKAQGISGKYLDKMNGANKPAKTAKTNRASSAIPANDIISYKAMNVDEAYINSLKAEGYSNLSNGKLTSMKAVGVDANFIRSLKAAGYKNVSSDDLVSTKALGITPEFAKSFTNAGYGNVPLSTLTSIKALGITPEYLKSFKNAGYNISLNDATSLKGLGVTPEFLTNFKDAGYKISISDALSIKALGITPEYLKSFASVGFDKLSISEATSVKAMGITPEYISKMKDKGFKSTDINKYIQLKAAFE